MGDFLSAQNVQLVPLSWYIFVIYYKRRGDEHDQCARFSAFCVFRLDRVRMVLNQLEMYR